MHSKLYKSLLSALIIGTMISCSMTHSLQRHNPTAAIKLPSNGTLAEIPELEDIERAVRMNARRVSSKADSVYIAEYERDSTGEVTLFGEEMETVTVEARLKHTVERNGEIAIDFIIRIPEQLQDKTWGLELTPIVENNGVEEELQPLSIKGELFSDLQKRQYWQMNKYLNRCLDDTTELSSTTSLAAKYYSAYNGFLSKNAVAKAAKLKDVYTQTIFFPYLTDPRLDSVLIHKGEIQYYYTQKYRPKKETRKLNLFFQGKITAIDRSAYRMPNSDTLAYIVTSMISMVDPTPRYMIQIVDKYVTVRDRNYITFLVGKSSIIDTLGDNGPQLHKIEQLMDTLLNQYQFFVDSVSITASSSPEGSRQLNKNIAAARALAIKQRLVHKFGRQIDTLIKTRSIGEDWNLLKHLIAHNTEIPHWEAITTMINETGDLDIAEHQIRQKFPKEYAYMRNVLYPHLRAVDFRYNLRRVDMVKDTIQLTVLDTTYMRGVQQLRDRDYAGALNTLYNYKDRNLAIVLISLGYDEGALEILEQLPASERNAQTNYLTAIVLSRMNRPTEGLEYYLEAVRQEPNLKYRGNLDPEIQILFQQNKVRSSL